MEHRPSVPVQQGGHQVPGVYSGLPDPANAVVREYWANIVKYPVEGSQGAVEPGDYVLYLEPQRSTRLELALDM